LLADTRLHFTSEAYFALTLRCWPAHLVPGFRLVLTRSRRLKVNWLTGRHFSSRPHSHNNVLPLSMAFLPYCCHQRVALALVPARGTLFGNLVYLATF
jgi:hypothetical protein